MNMKHLQYLLIMLCLCSLLHSTEFKPLRSFELSQCEDSILAKPDAFIVTEDNRIMAIDSKVADLKIYDMDGKRLAVFGRKGMGPQEFVRPRRMSYLNPFLAIVDYGRKAIFVYKLLEGNRFQFVKKFLCMDLGYDFQLLDGNTIMISGDKRNKANRLYNLYTYNMAKERYDFILPIETVFGLDSITQFQKDHEESIQYIGSSQNFDVTPDSIYHVWAGNPRILKIDRKTLKRNSFCKKTANYSAPYVNSEIRKAFHSMDFQLMYKLDKPMSMIRYLFASQTGQIGLIYTGPYKTDDRLPVILQRFTHEGEFMDETEILSAHASHHYEVYFYFRKSDNKLFVLDTRTDAQADQFFRMHVYQIK